MALLPLKPEVILSNLLLLIFLSVTEGDWGYGPSDDDWDSIKGTECDGKHQSPIDLIDVCTQKDDTVHVDRSLKLIFNHYDKPIKSKNVLFENNGHTAMIRIKGSSEVHDKIPSVSGSAVGNNTFQLQQIHFHWNRNGSHSGSEHSLYGHKKAFEMHLVHFNTKYGDMDDAGDHPDGSTVLSVLFDYYDCKEITLNDGYGEQTPDNPALTPITKKPRDINDAAEVVTLDDDLHLNDLLPNNTETFFWYQGSLTTPPCSEHLTWIVFPAIEKISKDQLDSFEHTFKNENGKLLGTTTRDIQPLNGKTLIITSDNDCQGTQENHDTVTEKNKEDKKKN